MTAPLFTHGRAGARPPPELCPDLHDAAPPGRGAPRRARTDGPGATARPRSMRAGPLGAGVRVACLCVACLVVGIVAAGA